MTDRGIWNPIPQKCCDCKLVIFSFTPLKRLQLSVGLLTALLQIFRHQYLSFTLELYENVVQIAKWILSAVFLIQNILKQTSTASDNFMSREGRCLEIGLRTGCHKLVFVYPLRNLFCGFLVYLI